MARRQVLVAVAGVAVVASLVVVGGLAASRSTPSTPGATATTSAIRTTTVAPRSPTPAPVPSIQVVPSSAHFTGAFPASCHSDGKHPDPACTPGSTRDTVTQATIGQTICVSGWTGTVRPSQSESGPEKLRGMKAYGVPVGQRSTTELDHFIPLELGGSNDTSNLWAQSSDIPNAAFRNSKDPVENRLADAVCGRVKGHQVTLLDAQRAIVTDWTTALARLGLA